MFNKTWLTGENVSADKLTDYLQAALLELYRKRLDIVSVASNNSLYLSHTDVNTFNAFNRPMRVSVDVPEGAAVKLRFYGMVDLTFISGIQDVREFTYLDVKVDNDFFLSSGTATPTTDGAMKQTHDNLVTRPVAFSFIMTELEAGQHTFELWAKATGNTGLYTVTLTYPSMFSAEVYGINSGHLIAANPT